MQVIALKKNLKASPRKIRLVVKTIKGFSPKAALDHLAFIDKKKTAGFLIDVLKQAMGNAKNNFKLDPESLYIKEIIVDEGPRYKRMDKSHGARFDRGVRKKRLSHLKIILESKTVEKKITEEKKPEPKMTVKEVKVEKKSRIGK